MAVEMVVKRALRLHAISVGLKRHIFATNVRFDWGNNITTNIDTVPIFVVPYCDIMSKNVAFIIKVGS